MKIQILPRSILFISMVCIAIDSSKAADEKWQVFRLPEGGVACDMPGKPTSEKQTVDTAGGPMQVVTHKVVLPTMAFIISLTKLPPNVGKVPTAQLLDHSRDGALNGI